MITEGTSVPSFFINKNMANVLTRYTDNKNFLSPLGFRLILDKTPNVEFFCQSATLPSITGNPIEIPNINATVNYPGDKLQFEPFTIRFRVDEDMANYLELFNWMSGIYHPEALDQFRNWRQPAYDLPSISKTLRDKYFSDASLLILTSNNNANMRINFENAFPINITPLNFDVTQSDIEYLEADCTFRYTLFTVEKI